MRRGVRVRWVGRRGRYLPDDLNRRGRCENTTSAQPERRDQRNPVVTRARFAGWRNRVRSGSSDSSPAEAREAHLHVDGRRRAAPAPSSLIRPVPPAAPQSSPPAAGWQASLDSDFGTLVGMISGRASVKIGPSRDGGIGRRVGLRIQCPKGVQVQILFPAPQSPPRSDVRHSTLR